jgi:hypothetical protein
LESRKALPPVSDESEAITSWESKFAFMLFISDPPLKAPCPRKLPVDASPIGLTA